MGTPTSLDSTGWTITLDEWASMSEDEPGELVDGRLVEEEVADYIHEAIVMWLGSLFHAWIVPRGGFVGGSDAKFAVSDDRGRKPDLTVFFPGRIPPRRGLVRIPPDIAVEIVSPHPRDVRRDRIEKLVEYALFGIRWYWILDPEARSLEVLELDGQGRYAHVLSATSGALDRIAGCEGLAIDLDALWSHIDRLADESDVEPG